MYELILTLGGWRTLVVPRVYRRIVLKRCQKHLVCGDKIRFFYRDIPV